ncbi:hypothetical protein BBJ28_00019050, partial [Nothophytophthora sp. Chile5]
MTDVWACALTPEAAPALGRLLQDEAPADERNDLGETALHVAAARGNDEAARLLLRHGADLLAADWVAPRLVALPATSPIVQLSASKYHTIALNAAGECFVWGFGKGGRLGTGSEFECVVILSRVEPTRLTSLATTPMQKVAAGENHTLALSRTGQVFSWGSNSFGQLGHPGKSCSSQSRLTPKRVDAFRGRVIAEIAASGCHSAAIDADDGAVYTWGSNRRGQLGRKEGCGTDQPDASPRSVEALRLRHPMCVVYGDYDSVRAEQLALSDWHTCVVLRCSRNGSSRGQVWQCGYGSYRPSRVNFSAAAASAGGSSGNGVGAIMSDAWVPSCKQRGVDIVQISCAQNHSIALSSSGAVFTWGHNAPALSHQPSGSSRDRHPAAATNSTSPSPSAPQKVDLVTYGPVANVCASQDHCAVVTQQGDLVTWGCGQQGVLGHGRDNTWQPSPKRVAGVKKAVAVAAGHQHTAVLVAPVHPEFATDSGEDSARRGVVLSLQELVEREIAAHVDVANCMTVWKYAERYTALGLGNYCLNYMRSNWDAVLDVMGRDRMELLFELMLPPLDDAEMEEKPQTLTASGAAASSEKSSKDRKAGKRASSAKCESDSGVARSLTAAVKAEDPAIGIVPAPPPIEEAPIDPHVAVSKASTRRKSGKFVPLTSFLSTKTASAVPSRSASSPWGFLTASTPVTSTMDETTVQKKLMPPASPGFSSISNVGHSLPEMFPLPTPSLRKGSIDAAPPRQRKTSIGSHPSASPRLTFSPLPPVGKHVLGFDGVEREQVTAFSLDAFIKQPASRRGARGKSDVAAAPTWSSSTMDTAVADQQSEQKAPAKTLKQIQEEEEAAAAQEREAKARLGGGNAPTWRSKSTVNSWGMVRPPSHVSLADVQKLQEEQEFLAQQRQIMAEIERENAEKAR